MNELYSEQCSCGDELPDLTDNQDDWDAIYTDIARQLLNNEDLSTDAVYSKTAKQLVEAMNKGYGVAYDDDDSRKALLAKFEQNIKQFSYAKTLTQFSLFKEYVFNDKGQIQSFAAVKKAVADTGAIFNNNYLRTELNYVTQTAIMAHKWETMDSEYLEFSTVGDSHVRPAHKLFDKFTALKSDPIWKRLYTPLDWNCRCTIIPGKASKVSKEYDSAWANKLVDPLVKGTIFDNNAALTGVMFTDKHPVIKANPMVLTMFFLPEDDGLKKLRKAKDAEIKEWAKTNIPEGGKFIKAKNFISGEATILRKNVKGISDHFTEPKYKDFAKEIVPIIKKSKYSSSASLEDSHKQKASANIDKKKARGVTGYNYYEFSHNDEKFRLNVEVIQNKEYPFSINKIVKAE